MEQENKIAIALNEKVSNALANNTKPLFEKAFAMSTAIVEIKKLLTPEVMKPIMALQGNSLGFKTDRDKDGGYPEEVVKNCIIEATLSGLEVVGNQFNIISGQMYGTKNGFGALLKKYPGLHYEITFDLPRINAEKTSAAATAKIYWEIEGTKNTRKLDLAINMNKYLGADAVIGKAERKARKWLYCTLTGTEMGEGDVQDVPHTEVTSTISKEEKKDKKENERILSLIESAPDLATLETYRVHVQTDEAKAAYEIKKSTLSQTTIAVEEDPIAKKISEAITLTQLEALAFQCLPQHAELSRLKKMEIGKKLQSNS